MNNLIDHQSSGDARLVELSLQGNRAAFEQVVARYQSLICGISYSACGDVGRSEDLAQETFLAAWKDIAALKEPGKLKSWLCGIARNLINNSCRRELRSPTGQAEPLQPEHPSEDASPDELAMSREEESLVWRALETIPPDYREPMVLFYREGQSTQAVAEALDLSDEVVRQRLSRGRVMLNERVARTVESALLRSAPGKAFTLGVIAALPGFSISAKAATLGVAAGKAGATAKGAAAMGLFGAILSPFINFLSMWLGYRMSIDQARSDRARAFVNTFYRKLIACILGFSAVLIVVLCCAKQLLRAGYFGFIAWVVGLAYCGAIVALSIWSVRARRKMLAEQTADEAAANPTRPVWEYRSKLHLLGLPFIHIRFWERRTAPVKAWIAGGNCAFGVLFAFGGLAIAPVSAGGCAVGLFSYGGLAVGALVLGGFGLGVWSLAGMAFGWQAFGGFAAGWDSASGGLAVARDFALGGLAHAGQANNPAAQHYVEGQCFFRYSEIILPYIPWIGLLWVAVLEWQRRIIARRAKLHSGNEN